MIYYKIIYSPMYIVCKFCRLIPGWLDVAKSHRILALDGHATMMGFPNGDRNENGGRTIPSGKDSKDYGSLNYYILEYGSWMFVVTPFPVGSWIHTLCVRSSCRQVKHAVRGLGSQRSCSSMLLCERGQGMWYATHLVLQQYVQKALHDLPLHPTSPWSHDFW